VPIIGGTVLLATRFSRMTPAMRVALLLLVALGVSSHVSFPPLALAMAGLVVLWLAWSNRGAVHAAVPGALLAGLPLVLGVGATMATGIAGFGEASVAPKRLPLVLARSMSDGPGRWYLEEACAIERYAVCEIWPDGDFPEGLGPILFNEGSIMNEASEEQLDRIREEEPEIVWNALLAYPGFQVQKTLSSIGRQFITFHPVDINFDRQFYRAEDGTLRASRPPREHSWSVRAVDALSHFVVPLAALLLLFAVFRTRRENLPVLLLCLVGIAANMVICATFSAVAGRYAMRVLWLVPLLAVLYAFEPVRSAISGLAGRPRMAPGAAPAENF
jgi:hypothetical protein